jgi:hypothetical protein
MTLWVYNLTSDEARVINNAVGGQIEEKRAIYNKITNRKISLTDRYRKYLARYLESEEVKEVNDILKIEFEIHQELRKKNRDIKL